MIALKMDFAQEMLGMSVEGLRALAKLANRTADDLSKEIPSYELALAAGIEDRSYQSVRNGWIPSYGGQAEVTLANGKKFRCVGHRNHGGDAYTAHPNGFIEFIPLNS